MAKAPGLCSKCLFATNIFILLSANSQYKLTAPRRPTLFLLHGNDANDTAEALLNLGGTVTDCTSELKMGLFHQENKFVFTTEKVLKLIS